MGGGSRFSRTSYQLYSTEICWIGRRDQEKLPNVYAYDTWEEGVDSRGEIVNLYCMEICWRECRDQTKFQN
jgi:hypothetical protein